MISPMRWGKFTGVALGLGLLLLPFGWGLIAAQGVEAAAAAEGEGDEEARASAKPDPATTGTITGKLVFAAATRRRRRLRRRYPGQSPGAKKGKKARWFPGVVFIESITAKPVSKDVVATMEQEGIAFDPPVLPVHEGTTVTFPNLDPVYHNVLSYSTAKRFDLGRYPQGEIDQDNSCTQYAMLALKSARRLGLKVPSKVFERVADHFVQQQDADGPDVPRFKIPAADQPILDLLPLTKRERAVSKPYVRRIRQPL